MLFDVYVEGGHRDRRIARSSAMTSNPTKAGGVMVCRCGRPATHTVSNGAVTLRTCYLHARKAAIALRAA
jgi:hypothetical protein